MSENTAKTLCVLVAAALAASACSRNNIEAVNLANEGDSAKKGGNLDEAVSKFDQATKLDPDNTRIWWKLALAYEGKEDWQKMASACTKAEEAAEKADKKKTHADYYFQHGHALEELAEKGQGTWADAKAPFQMAIQLDPNYGQAYGELGEVLIHADDEAGAIQNWTKALEVQPDETMYYVSLADEYNRLMFFDQAEQVLREGLSFAKEDDKHLFNMHALLGNLYENKGDFTRAVAEYEAAKKSCDSNKCNDHKEAYFNLGSAYAELNPPRKNEAIQQLQSFWKVTCKGALAVKYADQCSQSQEIVRRMGGSLQ
ncbi:MAG TPA: tetratricopeptide repeat protein [Polyangiaceae bacterium]|jgi:tetratricopeptide (TPR) repeat protein|nr:tetratricopeptide repeat protein [Polyangiaceae bacterium]